VWRQKEDALLGIIDRLVRLLLLKDWIENKFAVLSFISKIAISNHWPIRLDINKGTRLLNSPSKSEAMWFSHPNLGKPVS
jgi:hypothetical protein